MLDLPHNMPEFWEDTGKRRSAGPFLAAYLVPSPPADPVIPKKRGPRKQPRTIALPGTRLLDTQGRRTVDLSPRTNNITIVKSDWAHTTKLMKASI